jgi:hypothetical protein
VHFVILLTQLLEEPLSQSIRFEVIYSSNDDCKDLMQWFAHGFGDQMMPVKDAMNCGERRDNCLQARQETLVNAAHCWSSITGTRTNIPHGNVVFVEVVLDN